jgi:hypothetical protein
MWWKRRGAAGIRAILLTEWNPIWPDGDPPADEYDSYIGPIGRMLRGGQTAPAIAAYLTQITTERMDLLDTARAREHDEAIAEQLLRWYADEMARSD